MTNDQIIEALIDLNVEIQAIHLALEGERIPTETIKALRSEVDREAVRKKILERHLGL